MKTSLFVSGAAALMLTSTVAHASPDSRVQSYLDRAEAQTRNVAVAAGCNLDDQQISVRGYIGAEGRLKSVQVIGSSGSRDADRALEQALRHMPAIDTPDELIDGKLTLVFGHRSAKAS